MNSHIYVSIVVPIYNTSEYLRRCLDSCIYQSLPEIEVIVINDCSPDIRDEEIALEYKEKYPQKMVYIKNKENLGLGGARNKGIAAAKGVYVLCVDSDDYIDFDTCRLMYQKAVERDADMVMCGYNYLKNGEVMSVIENETNVPIIAVTKLTKKSLVIKNKLYFPEHHLRCEDLVTLLWNFASNKTVSVDSALYYYVSRVNSLTNSNNNKLTSDIVSVFDYSLSTDFFISINDHSFKCVVLKYFLTYVLDTLMEKCVDDESLQQNIVRIKTILTNKNLMKHLKTDTYIEKRNIGILKISSSSIKESLNELIISLTLEEYSEYKHRKIDLWGCGRQGRQLAQRLHLAGIAFECIDVNPKLHGVELYGNIISDPCNIIFDESDVIIVTAKGKYEEVKKRIGENYCIVDKCEWR